MEEVMVAGSSTSSGRVRAVADADAARPGPSDPLHASLRGLRTPIALSTNPPDTTAELDEARKQLFAEGTDLAVAKRRMEATQREYNSTYGFNLAGNGPRRRGEIGYRGRVVTDILDGKLPVYDTPAANIQATQVAHEEMATMEGDERARQEKHVQELLATANEQ